LTIGRRYLANPRWVSGITRVELLCYYYLLLSANASFYSQDPLSNDLYYDAWSERSQCSCHHHGTNTRVWLWHIAANVWRYPEFVQGIEGYPQNKKLLVGMTWQRRMWLESNIHNELKPYILVATLLNTNQSRKRGMNCDALLRGRNVERDFPSLRIPCLALPSSQ
jgi:hypothetical protein